MANILLIDDDDDLSHFLRADLEALGYTVECLNRAEEGPARLATGQFALVLLDNKMPGMTGIEFLEALRARQVAVDVILMTGESTPDTAIQATKLGAYDYVVKPGTVQELVQELEPLIRQALAIRAVPAVRVPTVTTPIANAEKVLVGGKNKRMLSVYKMIAQFAEGDVPVQILGETGTGKELVAHALHTNSPRKGKPFVALNCTAFTETLIESELFGHEANAFTGAKFRKGKIEYANGGTLFLDEIGDMPFNLQAKLLRVLDDKQLERLGSNESIKVDVRLLSATHQDLDVAIQEKRFRRDLQQRLNTVTIRLPPLRERLEDLPELAAYFLTRAAESASRPRPGLTDEALEMLRAYHWPGNVRELRNVIFRAFGVCPVGQQVLPGHIEFTGGKPATATATAGGEAAAVAGLVRAAEWAWETDLPDALPELQLRLERELLRFYLARLGGNKTEVARRLKMSRTTLDKRIKEYDLE